jgi:fused signal recognition particle receptor
MSVFKLFKSSNDKKTTDETIEDEKIIESAKKEAESEQKKEAAIQSEISIPSKKGFISKLKSGLKKTSVKFGAGFSDILLGKKIIDDDLIDEIEMQLLVADIGVDSTNMIMEKIRGQVKRNELQTSDQLIELIKSELQGILAPCTQKLEIETDKKPYVLLMMQGKRQRLVSLPRNSKKMVNQ